MPRPMLKLFAAMTFAGWVATIAGWYVTEIGRQPFIVAGLIRTSDVASRVPSSSIALTLSIYIAVYLALLVAYVGVLKHMSETSEKKPGMIASEGLAESPQKYQHRGEFV
jgi:cytochrome bd ubiquinol oxidase subunit I